VYKFLSVFLKKRSVTIELSNEQSYFLTYSHDYGFIDAVQLMAVTLSEMSLTLLGMEDSLMNKIFEELLTDNITSNQF